MGGNIRGLFFLGLVMENLYAIITCLPDEHFTCEPEYDDNIVFPFLFLSLTEIAIISSLDKFVF